MAVCVHMVMLQTGRSEQPPPEQCKLCQVFSTVITLIKLTEIQIPLPFLLRAASLDRSHQDEQAFYFIFRP